MLVEDDHEVRDAFAQALDDEGVLVRQFSNGREALDALQHGYRPDVILLDLMMPVMDGRTFLARRKADPQIADIPVVVVSAQASWGGPLDVESVLHKPVGLDALLKTVQRFC